MKTNIRHVHVTAVGVFFAIIVMIALIGVSSVYAMSQQLDLGDQNADVSALQTYLSKNPNIYPSGLVTGFFGPLTQEGTQKFQTNQGIVSEGDATSTGYGRVGPQTLARLNSLMAGTVIYSNNGVDVDAPRIYPAAVVVSNNTVTISWTTSESAKGRVMYGTSWPFLYATAPSVSTGSYGATAVITITGLQSHTTYYYVRESIDVAGNIMWTTYDTFTTQ